MGKIHVLMRKEEIDPERIKGKIAVVLDVLSATSTMAAALVDGAVKVIPVIDRFHALEKANLLPKGSYVLAGEEGGRLIDGFHYPDALELKERVPGKTLILSTTNGTVAVHRASAANRVYIASLLNGEAVARKLAGTCEEETIVLICSGSAGRFNMEDFYGAGYVLDCLLNTNETGWEMTDAARAALYFFQKHRSDAEKILLKSRVGKRLTESGFEDKVRYIARQGILNVVPIFRNESITLKEDQ